MDAMHGEGPVKSAVNRISAYIGVSPLDVPRCVEMNRVPAKIKSLTDKIELAILDSSIWYHM